MGWSSSSSLTFTAVTLVGVGGFCLRYKTAAPAPTPAPTTAAIAVRIKVLLQQLAYGRMVGTVVGDVADDYRWAICDTLHYLGILKFILDHNAKTEQKQFRNEQLI